jgi:hypothetical protein
MRGRTTFMQINQSGRFSNDESFWKENLSQPKLATRSFHLLYGMQR